MNSEWFLENQASVRQLVLAVYRVANVMRQKKEGVLANELKKQANRILRLWVGLSSQASSVDKLVLEIEILENFFEISQAQHLLKEINFVILKKEFSKLKNDILRQQKSDDTIQTRKTIQRTKAGTIGRQPVVGMGPRVVARGRQGLSLRELNKRQNKLMSIIKKQKEIGISDVSDMFNGQVSEKTVRRDLIGLINQGLIGRKGDKRWTKYYYV